jgi:hypothetical protein
MLRIRSLLPSGNETCGGSSIGGRQSTVKAPSRNGRLTGGLLVSCCFLPALSLIPFPLCAVASAYGQVGPAEITNPQLKAAEQAYLPQMLELNRAVAGIKFPFAFMLSRYAGLAPKEQIGADTRGLEFVHFHDRLVLKLTGNYNAAYSVDLLTPNQRANRVFDDVVVSVLRLLPDHFSSHDQFDAFGFEIAYHIRTHGRGFEYEGKEILVLVMDKPDALNFIIGKDDTKRQEALNRSEIYLNGKLFGFALGMRDPFDAEALEHSVRSRTPAANSGETPAQSTISQHAAAQGPQYQQAILHEPVLQLPKSQVTAKDIPSQKETEPSAASPRPDPDNLQKKYQLQLDALATQGASRHHFVDYAPPSFVVFRNQIALQLTLRNPTSFDKDITSIYKRAAQSFDLFLAPQLKPILDKVPDTSELSSLDITVIDELAAKSSQSSEAVEFIFPLKVLRRFVDSEITNQELIDQSVVLVNGVRIALNLQLVE